MGVDVKSGSEKELQLTFTIYPTSQIDLLDVYDWHFIPAAVTLKSGLGIPFIYSVESLEDHRSQALNTHITWPLKALSGLAFMSLPWLV